MKLTQQKIAAVLNVSQPFINQLMRGRKKVSWPLASKLSELFPEKTIQQWKAAAPEEIKTAIELSKDEAA